MPRIGDRMRSGATPVMRGQPEKNFFRLLRRELDEVRAYLEDGQLAAAVDALEEVVDDLVERVESLEEKMAALEEALITDPDGNTSLRIYAARDERVMDALLEIVMDIKERLRRNDEEKRDAK